MRALGHKIPKKKYKRKKYKSSQASCVAGYLDHPNTYTKPKKKNISRSKNSVNCVHVRRKHRNSNKFQRIKPSCWLILLLLAILVLDRPRIGHYSLPYFLY